MFRTKVNNLVNLCFFFNHKIKCTMLSREEILNRELVNNKSIAFFAKGYYVSSGGEHGFDLKIPFYDMDNVEGLKPHETTRILVDYLGSIMWINVRIYQLFYGSYPVNYHKEAQCLRSRLENIIRLRLEKNFKESCN